MSTQWTNSAGGDWTVAGNWSAGAPTASVDATLGVLSSYYTVTLTASGAANSLTIGGYSVTLNLSTTSGSSPASLAVQGNLSNAGDLYVDSYYYATGGSTLTIGGTLSNTGYLDIGNSSLLAATTVTAAGLANTGTIYLYGGTGTDTSQTVLDITGSAPASNAGSLVLQNGATLQTQGDFNNTGYLDVYSYTSGTSSVTIGGTLINTGTLAIQDQNTSGTTTVSAKDLVNTSTIDLYGGTGTAQAILDITAGAAPALLTGALTLSGNALLDFASGSIASIAKAASLHLTGATAFVADAGSLGSNSALSGLARNDGTLELDSGATIQTQGDFLNDGTLYVDYYYNTSSGSGLTVGGTLSNAGTLDIGNAYQSASVTTVSAAGLANTGGITLAGGTGTSTYQATLDITSEMAPAILTGTLSLSGNALVEFAGSASIAGIGNNATLNLNGGKAFVADAAAPTSNSALSGLASNAGTLELDNGAAIRTQGDFSNNGTLYIDYSYYTSGSDLAIGGTLSNAGSLYVDGYYYGTGGGTLSIGGALINTNYLSIGSTALAAATTVSAAGLVNTRTINLTGGTGTGSNQATLDVTGSATDNGTIAVYGNAILSAGSLTVANGGSVTLTSGGTASGVSIGGGGREIVYGGGISVAPTIAGGVLELSGGVVSGGGIVFAGGGTLQIDGTTMPTNPIAGFAAGDAIDLRALTFGSTTTASYDSATSTLTVSGGVTDTLTLSGVPAGTGFAVARDGIGGTIVTEAPAAGSTQWTNSAGGDWTVAGNWSAAGVPAASVDALFGVLSSNYTVTLTAGGAANSLTIAAYNTLDLSTTSGSAPASLAVQGNLSNGGALYLDTGYAQGGSTLTIGGTLTNTYSLQIGTSYGNLATATTVTAAGLANTNSLYLYGGTGTDTNQAVLDITSGTAPASNASTLALESGATFRTQGDFDNSGNLYVYSFSSGTSSLTIGGTLTNTGTLYIQDQNTSGTTTASAADLVNRNTIYLYGGGSSSAQAILDITSGTAPSLLTGAFTLSGHALLEFTSGSSIASIASGASLVLNGGAAFVAEAGDLGSNSALRQLANNDGTLDLEFGAVVAVAGDFSNTGSLDLDTTYYAAGGSTLTIGGTLVNTGTLQIGYGNNNLSAATTVSATALTNTGYIYLYGGSGTAAAQAMLDITSATAPSVLTGTVQLSGNALVEFAGSGSIASLASNAVLLLNGASAFVADAGAPGSNSALTGLETNDGTLYLASGAQIDIQGDFLNNNYIEVDYGYATAIASSLTIGGTLSNAGYLYIGNGAQTPSGSTVSAGALDNTGTITLNGGTNTAQATLDITSGTAPSLLAGSLSLTGRALIEFAGSASITSIATGGQIILNGGSAFIANSSDTTSNSALTGLASNAGYLYLENGETLQTQSDFSNTSNLELYDNATSGVSSLTIGGTLSNTSTITIDNQTTSGATTVSAQDLVNIGTINLTGGAGTSTAQARLDITPATAPAVLTGDLSLSGDALVDFAGGSIAGIANTATLHLSGANAFIADASNTSSNSALTGLASNAGTLELDSGAQLAITGDFANSGSLQVDYYYYYTGGSNLSIGGTLSNTGYLYIGTTYQTTSATTVSAADLANAGSIYLYGGSGTAGHQTTLDIAGAATDSGTLYLYGDAVLSAGSLTVASGGTLDLNSGGTAGAIVGSGGHEYVHSGGISTSTTIAGGTLELAGGSVTAATIDFTLRGGVLQIDGAMPSNTIAGFRQSDIIDLRGVAFDSTGTGSIDAGSALTVSAGGSTYTLQLDPLHNYANTRVIVTSDGSGYTNVAILTPTIFVVSAQTLQISGGVTDDNVNVLSGGTLVVSGGTATDTINNGSEILSGGLDLDGIVGGGGTMLVAAGGIASNTTVSPLGQLTVISGGSVSNPTIAGGILDLAAGAVASGTIAFTGTGGTLEIDGATMPTNPITGFAAGDMIDLRALAWSTTNTVNFDPLTNTLTISGGRTTDTLTLTGVVAGTQFAVASDGSGGTTVGTIQNNATLTGTYLNGVVLSNPTAQNPTTLATGGYVTNQTTAHNGDAVYGTNAAAWTFSNYGTINGTGTAGDGVNLSFGGSVTNAQTGLIAGPTDGVAIAGAAGTVNNFGTVAGGGVYLIAGGLVANNQSALIDGTIQAVAIGHGTGTVLNSGRIIGTGTNSGGIYLTAGGSVTNAQTGIIEGTSDGIDIGNQTGTAVALGTVENLGTIIGSGASSTGIFLISGGGISNGAGAVITAGADGVVIGTTAGGAGTVINDGSIGGANLGLWLDAGGSVTNSASGTITSLGDGLVVQNGPGMVVNSGTVAETGTGGFSAISLGTGTVTNYGLVSAAGTTAGVGVYFGNGGSLGNSGLITGYINGAAVLGSYGLVDNLGTIAGTGTSGLGVYLAAGGSVTNAPGGGLIGGGFAGVKLQTGGAVLNGVTATITGGKYGVWAETAAANVSNYGTIAGTGPYGDGLFLNNGGAVPNASGALITGVDDGVCIAGSAGTVVNSGAITGTGTAALGVMLGAGSSVTNAAAAALIAGGATGVYVRSGPGTVDNLGTITATQTSGTGIDLADGGSITNRLGGLIASGGDAVVIDGTSGGSLSNYGTIAGGYDGVVLKAAGSSVSNYRTIIGTASYGVYLYSGDSATNASTGLIEGGYAGVLATHSAGTVTNLGTIIGTGSNGVGVNLMVAGSTLTNAGTIIGAGGNAVTFTGANNRLIIDAGAFFSGGVYGGGGGSDVLELAAGSVAATGTILSGPGRYPGFDQFTVDPSARWLVTGTRRLAPGSTLSNAGTLAIATNLSVGGSLLDTGVIDIGAGATLALANGAGGTGSIDFAGPGGILEIDGTTMPAATVTISGFTPGETIDLRGVSGGNAGGATLDATHLVTVFEGGSSFALQLDQAQSFGGFAVVGDGSGGTDVFALAQVVVSAGVPFVVSAGQTLIGVSVESGGTLDVASGASVFGTQISSGGSEIVDSGGIDSGTLVFSGGSQTVAFGGTALGTVLDGVAVQLVSGFAGDTTVSSGDSQIVEAGGVASSTTILTGGSETVLSGGLTIDTVIAGGNLVLSAGAATSGSIDFVGSGGVLQIDSNAMPTTTISGFALGDSIDLHALPYNAGNSVTFNAGVLTVVGGSTTDTLTLSGVPSGTVFGLASDVNGDTLVQEVVRPPASLFDFVFTYNDGKDYYFGTVADDGTYGYFKGEQITTLPGVNLVGQYDIFEQEGLLPATPLAAGTVFILGYSHGGPGVASPTPLSFPAPDGTMGLGSESDAVLGTDGQTHPFGPAVTATLPQPELSFATADLFGFVFSYADGAVFYSGTVAVTTGTTPAIPASAGILGTYSVFAEGATTRAAGTVVVDRFTASDASFIPNSGGAIDGTGGLGSETDSITVNGQTASFSDQQEPALTLSVPTVPTPPPPGTTQVITAELTQIYSEVLGRSPSSTELQTDSSELTNGTALSSIRATLAQSTEAQGDLDGLYHQIFDRSATSAELATQTGALAGGSSLQTVQLILAQSPEVQTDLAASYSEVLGRAIGGSELTADMVQIGNESATAVVDPNGRSGVAGVRDILAQSPEVQNDLTQLFQSIVGSAPTAAQLLGMEVQLGKPGFSLLQTLQPALTGSGAAAAGVTIAAGAGNATLTASSGTPTLFDFTNIGFGNDTIAGFDPTRDTIELPHAVAANLATLLQQDTTATAGGTLITPNSSQSIVLNGIAPTSLSQTNFLLV